MQFLDTTLRVKHTCPLCDLSIKFPEVKLIFWCNDEKDVLQIVSPEPALLEAVGKYVRNTFKMEEMINDGKASISMSRCCSCDCFQSVTNIVEQSGCWYIPPVTAIGGWEYYRIISFGKASLKKMYSEIKKIGKIEIISHKNRERLDVLNNLDVASVHLLKGLTDKQIHVLVSAFENGLFNLPSDKQMEAVARSERLSRSTYGEHLKKALLQLMKNSYPLLKLHDFEPPPERDD